jgi:hypothetical protein
MNFKNLEKRPYKIGNIEKEILYDILEDLPSGKRSYPDIGKVYIRGLFYGEVLELSRITSDSLEDSIKIYKDAIKFENEKYKLEDLELVDYILVTAISNIMTTKDFNWYPDFICSNIIRNPKITQLENQKEEFETVLKELKELLQKEEDEVEKEKIEKDIKKISEELKKIKDKIENFDEDEYVPCNTPVTTPINLDSFEIEIKDPNIIFPVYYKMGEVELELKALSVQDQIELEKVNNLNEDIATLAKHIKNMPFEDAYKFLKISMPYEIEDLKNYIDRFDISLKPILTRCPRCGKEYELLIDLKDIKVLPRV